MMKLGILGFGIVGKSALSFFDAYRGDQRMIELLSAVDYEIIVWDQRELKVEELLIIQKTRAYFVLNSQVSLEQFFLMCDKVLVSPGIDVRGVEKKHEKILCELDLFSVFFTKPVIAITGSFGKTTTTALLQKLLAQITHLRVGLGGNIGIGMLDLIAKSDEFDYAVIEVSSWQLEHSKRFAPDIAVWTNLYPNHLDRHETMIHYAQAKYRLIAGQSVGQQAVLAADIFAGDIGEQIGDWIYQQKSSIILSCMTATPTLLIQKFTQNLTASVCVQDEYVILETYEQGVCLTRDVIGAVRLFPSITFLENWLQIVGALYASGLTAQVLAQILPTVLFSPTVQENPYAKHRVEYIATIGGVDFYNDSKSTVIETTQAAVKKLAAQAKPIMVILGGLNKGVDRSSLVPFLASIPQVKKIYSFGAAHDFKSTCYFSTLEAVVDDIMSCMQSGDIVLFSPSGSSYDLFENYQHRGEVFKELVLSRGNPV